MDTEQRVRLSAMRCLGALGAVSPSKFRRAASSAPLAAGRSAAEELDSLSQQHSLSSQDAAIDESHRAQHEVRTDPPRSPALHML